MVEVLRYEEYEAFISYLETDNRVVEGWFKVISDNGWALKFRTNNNILTVPHCRILRLKERETGK